MHHLHVSKTVTNTMQHCTQSTEERGQKKYFSEYTPGMEYINRLTPNDPYMGPTHIWVVPHR